MGPPNTLERLFGISCTFCCSLPPIQSRPRAPHGPPTPPPPGAPGPQSPRPLPLARVAGAVRGRGEGPAGAHWRGLKASGARAGAAPRGGAAIRAGRWRPQFACSPAELREARPAPGPPFRPPPPPGPRPPALGPPAPPPGWRPRVDAVRHAADSRLGRRRRGRAPPGLRNPRRLLFYLPQRPSRFARGGGPPRRQSGLQAAGVVIPHPRATPPALPGAQPGRSHSSLCPERLQR